ncbi:MAG: hypothetical protein HY674_21125 [Chloroflexi bacterium]|nr:hypothetical protein [Chloroflexota bacterium]
MNPQPTPGSKLGIDATKKLPGEGFKRPWPPLIKMDEAVKAKVKQILGERRARSLIVACRNAEKEVNNHDEDDAYY